jgi:arabinoxylan arabinofuranohydrolase
MIRCLAWLAASWLASAMLFASDRWDAPHAGNPILPGYFADPSLVQHGGKFYLYATLDPWGGKTLGCWESPDFKNWTYATLNWPTKEACTSPSSKGAMVWAPSVVRSTDGKFFMYISVGSEVWVGSADHPLGPWRDANDEKPIIPATWNPAYHMIDAECFIDDDGTAWLYWGSGWGWKNGRCFAAKLKSDMTTFDGEPCDVTPAGHYFEGPFMVKHGGRYYLTYSDGKTITDTYCVHYAVGDSPLGPFTEAPNGPILSTDLTRNIVSPGHHAVFRHEGRAYILYHRHSIPYVPEKAFRQTCVDELHFESGGQIASVIPTHAGPARLHGRVAQTSTANITASSSLDEIHGPARALDDNYATRWAPAGDDKAPWLQIDLGTPKEISLNEFRFEYAWKTYRFLLETSLDGRTWKVMADYRDAGIAGSPVVVKTPAAHAAGTASAPILITPPIEARYLRLVFPDNTPDPTPSLFEWTVN